MNQKRKVLRIAIFAFMALSLTLTTSQTLAYWASDVTGDTTTSSGTVNTGTWNTNYWDPNLSYSRNDIVTYNGIEYIAIKNNVPAGKEPGVDTGFWGIN